MHICHINLAKGFRGGERQTFLLMLGLSKTDTQQKLICRKNSDLARKAKSIEGLEVIEIGKPFLFHTLKVTGSDLIHVHEGRSSHFAYFANKTTQIPYIITRRIPNKPSNSFFTKKAYKNATRIIGLSNAIKNQLLEYDSQLPCNIIPSMRSDLPCNEKVVEELRSKYKNQIIIGHIGALVDHHKGQRTIIDAAKQLLSSHPHIRFLLLGQGKDENLLREEAKDLANIEFVGFVDNVGDYIELFDYFVFPSNEEGLGSILLDVMQFRKPVIASDVDGIPDIIQDESNGLLIKPKDSAALATSIVRLIEDPELAQRLTNNAWQTVQNYDVESITNRYIKLYKELLQNK